jgi:hypothetical protein
MLLPYLIRILSEAFRMVSPITKTCLASHYKYTTVYDGMRHESLGNHLTHFHSEANSRSDNLNFQIFVELERSL